MIGTPIRPARRVVHLLPEFLLVDLLHLERLKALWRPVAIGVELPGEPGHAFLVLGERFPVGHRPARQAVGVVKSHAPYPLLRPHRSRL